MVSVWQFSIQGTQRGPRESPTTQGMEKTVLSSLTWSMATSSIGLLIHWLFIWYLFIWFNIHLMFYQLYCPLWYTMATNQFNLISLLREALSSDLFGSTPLVKQLTWRMLASTQFTLSVRPRFRGRTICLKKEIKDFSQFPTCAC